MALDEAPPATPASQLIEDWNGEAETGGRGRLLSSFKERVHGMTQRQSSQSQVQIEKELVSLLRGGGSFICCGFHFASLWGI